jgi:hypothetical protein
MKRPPSDSIVSESRSGGWLRPRWTWGLGVVCLVQFILLLFLTGMERSPDAGILGRQLKPYSPTNQEPYFAGHSGPWGELEYARLNIEPTDEFVAEEIKLFDQTRWFFAEMTREQVLELFAHQGLNAAQQTELRDGSTWAQEAGGVLIVPTGNFIMSLAPEVRGQIYSVLARSNRNDLQVAPFVYRLGGFTDWFGQSGLTATTLALVQQVVYQRGSALCVSDAPELLVRITDPDERRKLIKTLSRSAALLMKIRIRSESDVAALTAYWGRGWHVKDIEPLLASLTKVPGSISLDIAHLLPPFARQRLNSYPHPQEPGQRVPDCYWSAWNFFRDPPADRYFDEAIWRQELQQNYQLVEAPIFGDLVFLARADGVPIHCAVFIADDVVFTKNGANPRQPWKLMKMEDMLARYPEEPPVRVAVFRPRAEQP